MGAAHKPLIAKSIYYRRVFKGSGIAIILIVISLGIGIAGYHYFENLSLVDALLNASMILTGMGPVDVMKTNGGKIFASLYALYSGVTFLTIAALLFAPVYQRFLHKFHLEIENTEKKEHTDQIQVKPIDDN